MIEVEGREPIEIPGWRRFMNMRHRPYVYRCYSSGGVLLYVGRTIQLPDRFSAHAQRSAWWPQVARYTLEECATWSEVVIAEQRAIRDEGPTMNRRRPGRQAELYRSERALPSKRQGVYWERA